MKRNRTIKINDEYLDIVFDYQPEEKPTRDYPGCNEEVEIQEVLYKSVDILPVISDEMLEEIINKISENE